MLYGTLGAVLVALGLVWMVARTYGYRTLAAGSRGLPHSKYVTVDFVAERADTRLRIQVEGRQEKKVSTYLFTQEEYDYFTYVMNGRGPGTRPFAPVWGHAQILRIEEEDIALPGPGKYLFVVVNDAYNEAATMYRLSAKRLR